MQYSVYALLGVISWLCHGEIERDNSTLRSQVMVELSTRKREIRGNGGNHHGKLGVTRILCASQLTTPDTAGTSPDLVCNFTNMRFCKPNQASHTPDFSRPLGCSISFSSSSPIAFFLLHYSSIIG
jgi:hypothetical protein